MQRQVELLSKIIGVMHDSAPPGCSGMECEFDHEYYDGGWSVGSRYSYVVGEARVSEHLCDPEDMVSDYVHELHGLMKAQSGGDWVSFLLVIDAEGKASARFSC